MPPTNALIFALAAGLVSAVVFVSATTGPMILRLVLFFLTPLSIYLAGLGLGPAAAAIATIAASVIILLLANPLSAVLFAVTSGVPAVVASRLTLLSRGEGDDQEWYPLGRIVAAAALFGGLFSILVLAMMGGDVEVMTKLMREAIDAFIKNQLVNLPNAPTFTPEQIDELAKTTLASLPWVLGGIAMATILLNLWLAGRVTFASGRLVRPWPDLAMIELPGGAIIAFVFALALTFVGGIPGLFAGGFAGALMIAFALVGLGTAHVLTRTSPWRSFILSALYAALIVFTAPILILLSIAGLAETIFGYRILTGGPPPASPPETPPPSN